MTDTRSVFVPRAFHHLSQTGAFGCPQWRRLPRVSVCWTWGRQERLRSCVSFPAGRRWSRARGGIRLVRRLGAQRLFGQTIADLVADAARELNGLARLCERNWRIVARVADIGRIRLWPKIT